MGIRPGIGIQSRPADTLWKEIQVAENVAKRSGWVTFAGLMALVAGVYNALSGIGALSDDDTIASRAREVLYGIDLTAWGWFWLIVGLAQVLTGILILQRSTAGFWLGIGFASLSAVLTVFVSSCSRSGRSRFSLSTSSSSLAC
jgi:hypothetical protein